MISLQKFRLVKKLLFISLLSYSVNVKSQSSKDNAPDVYKFDALGASDLVNLPTGDFNYTVPVLNVPGPEGGYDVRLTYSASIRMEQDASWVGLGWNCSPGAIVRTVNGTPDDVKEYEAISLNRDYGTTTFPDIQVFDFFNQVHAVWTVSAAGTEIDPSSQVELGGTYNSYNNRVSSNTIVYLGLAIQDGLNRSTSNYSQSVGAGDNGGNVGFLNSKTINNTQLSHTGGQLSLSLDGGGQNTLFYDIGHYSDLDWEAYSNFSKYSGGAFYLGNGFESDQNETWRQTYNRTMDIYTNQTAYDQNVIGTNNLSFPAYDEYSVSADGLSGTLCPISMKDAPIYGSGETANDVYSQYLIDSSDPTNQYIPNADFSGSNQNKLSFLFRGQHASVKNTPGTFAISGSTVTSVPGSLVHVGGYCSANNKIFAGKNVITDLDANGLIKGFRITNEDGITYNFTKPVYQFERIQSSTNSQHPNAKNIKVMQKKYAYAWLLESITGADYIDSGAPGIDVLDEGYWVKFNYGTWTNGFVWSDPYDGIKEAKTINDEDRWKTVTSKQMGIKELAYLNSVETRTHIAYFAKFIREDGLGSNLELNETITLHQPKEIKSNEIFSGWVKQKDTYDDYNYIPSDATGDKCYVIPGDVHRKLNPDGSEADPIDFDPVTGDPIYDQDVTWTSYTLTNFDKESKLHADQNSSTNIKLENRLATTSTMDKKQRVMGLKKIILVNRENDISTATPVYPTTSLGVNTTDDVIVVASTSILNPKYNGNEIYNKNYFATSPCVTAPTIINSLIGRPTDPGVSRKKYFPSDVIDIADIANCNIETKALQIVELNYDYSLCGNAPNSLPLTTGSSTNKGRLTLKSIDIKDPNGNKISPSNNFTYGLNPSYEQVNIGTTAVPQWLKMQDDWGYRVATNTNLGKIVNKDVYEKDLASAWSLTQIETPLGGKIKINYESDVYVREAATTKNFDAQIESFQVNNSTDCRNIMVLPLALGFGSTPTFVVGNSYNISLFQVHSYSCPTCSNQYPVLSGKFLSSTTSSGSIMSAKFEITSGWDTDDDYSFLSSSYVTDETSINRTFSGVTTSTECNSIIVKYEEGVSVAAAFLVNNVYTITLAGNNIVTWAGTLGNPTQPVVINNATAQSINVTTNEVTFSVTDYNINFTNSLIPESYSFSSSESSGRQFYGGGVRVKDLIMQDENSNEYKTVYEYQTGVTSFAPGNLWRKDVKYISELPGPGVIYGKVIEKSVGANNEINSVKEYEYETMNSNIEGQELSYGDQLYIENGQVQYSNFNSGIDHRDIYTRVGTIHNNTGRIGRMNKIIHKNNSGLILSTEKYNYAPKESALSGVSQESFREHKRKTTAIWTTGGVDYYSTMCYTYSSRIFYPTELTSVERLKSNVFTNVRYGKSSSPNNGFDVYTHKPLVTENVKASGEILGSKYVLAYVKYSELGSKVCAPTNKNMLGMIAEQIDYIVNEAGEEKILGASAKTFSKAWNYRKFNSTSNVYENINQTGIYRLDKTYKWGSLLNVDGTVQAFTDYNWVIGALNDDWQEISSSLLFNNYSKGLETQNINKTYSSTKMGYKNSFVVASAANAKYAAFAFSSAEDIADANYFGGEVAGAYNRSTSLPHTGKYSVKLNAGETGFSFSGSVGTTRDNSDFQNGQKIRANVWLHKLNALNGKLEYVMYASDGTTIITSGFVDKNSPSTKIAGTNWYLLTLDIDIPAPAISGITKLVVKTTNGGTLPVYFDDFKVQPAEAVVTGSVYDAKTGWISATLDADNFGTKYYYDSAGRLLRVDKETLQGWKKVSENVYHYGRP